MSHRKVGDGDGGKRQREMWRWGDGTGHAPKKYKKICPAVIARTKKNIIFDLIETTKD